MLLGILDVFITMDAIFAGWIDPIGWIIVRISIQIELILIPDRVG